MTIGTLLLKEQGYGLVHPSKLTASSEDFPVNSDISREPTGSPTTEPTATPTVEPTATPTTEPTATPTTEPTATPTTKPTAAPTTKPTAVPTARPTAKPTAQPQPTVTTAPPSGSYADFQIQVTALVNAERTSRGLNPLTQNTKLSEVATLKSQDMADLGYFDHNSPTYGSPFEMMEQFGITYRAAGENIAYGQTTPAQVMVDWMNSEGHRNNILLPDFTQLGIGIVKNSSGRIYWTQMFIG